jgi:hypothetical protein
MTLLKFGMTLSKSGTREAGIGPMSGRNKGFRPKIVRSAALCRRATGFPIWSTQSAASVVLKNLKYVYVSAYLDDQQRAGS